jgi:hypothetical protein
MTILILFLSLLTLPAPAQQATQPPQQQTRTQSPTDAEQLSLVRLRAQILEAQAKMQQAQRDYEAAKKQMEEGQQKFAPALEAAKAKLPPPAKGKQWQPQDDGQMGVVFVEVEATAASAKKGGDR